MSFECYRPARRLAAIGLMLVLWMIQPPITPGQPAGPEMQQAGTSLTSLYESYRRHVATGKAGFTFDAPHAGLPVRAGHVNVEVVTEEQSARRVAARLQELGADHVREEARLVTAWLPVEALPAAVAISGVHSIYPVLKVGSVGAVTSRGVPVMETDALRTALASDGAGVTVGILSNSFNNYDNSQPGSARAADDIETGDLPAPSRIRVLREQEEPGSDEGRAMMQIAYDVAPGADFAFHTASGGRTAFADGIRALAEAGASVIVDDILYLNEPVYQDGLITQAIDEVVRRQDVVFVTSAGNAGRDAYETPFRGSGRTGAFGGELHDFDPGPGVDTVQRIRIEPDSRFQIPMHWLQPYASTGGPGAVTDMEIYLVDKRGNVLTALEPERRDNIGGDPFEFVNYQPVNVDADGDGQQDVEYGLVIERISGPSPERIRYVPFEQAGAVTVDEFATDSPGLYGHPNAASAVTVAATAWFDTPRANPDLERPLVHTFSSVGGTPVLFDDLGQPVSPEVRRKPDVTGPDGVNTTFFGQELDDGDDFPNFFGTSAAAPHVAGLAAIIRSAHPEASPLAVKEALIGSGVDIRETRDDVPTTLGGEDAEGFDFFSGTGLVKGDRVSLNPLPIAELTATVEQAGPGGAVRVSWRERANVDIAGYRLERSYAGGAYRPEADVAGRGEGRYEETADDLRPGVHTFRLRWTTGGGQRIVGPETEVTVSVNGDLVVTQEPFPNPATTSVQVELTSSSTQTVLLALYDVTGRYLGILHVGTLRAGQPSRIRLNRLDRFASGQHFIRVIGDTVDTAIPVTLLR